MPTVLSTSNCGRTGPLAIVTIFLALLLAACTSGTTSPASDSGSGTGGSSLPPVSVFGTVTAGPTCPVERVGHPCPPAPVHGTVVADNSGGARISGAQTDSHGRYTLRLSRGSYTFLVVTAGGPFPICPKKTVTVGRGVSQRIDIRCDTGIR